jgi:hypothetical protein
MSNVCVKEVDDFSNHCLYIRSLYTFAIRIFKDGQPDEHAAMEAIAPLFFEDLAQVFADYMVIAACRVTDDADAGRGRENFTVELFVKHFAPDSEAFKQLDAIHQRMKPFRTKILPARNKLAAHADRAAVGGAALGKASWQEWAQFWSDLADFVGTLNEQMKGKPFEIDAAGVTGDAEMLLKALAHARYFDTLLDSSDPTVKAACLKVALPET